MSTRARIAGIVSAAIVAAAIALPAVRFGGSPAADPPAELQEAVAPVRTALAGAPGRDAFAAWCLAAADCIERDAGGAIRTAEALRAFNARAVELRFLQKWDPPAGLAEAMDRAMLAWVGPKPGELSVERRDRAIACYRAFAWAAR